MGVQVKVSASGSIRIPADVRRQLGLEKGGSLMLNVDEFGITLTSFQQRIAKAQAKYREYSAGRPPIDIEEFLAEKREDAAMEKY